MNDAQMIWRARQHRLNLWVTDRKLLGVEPVREDGEPGPATRKRIRQVKFWLGYQKRDGHWDQDLHERLLHTFSRKASPASMIRRGIQRRRAHNRSWRKNRRSATRATGVVTFDAKPCAAWLAPYLQWARDHGWQGRLNSGWRDPAYSEQLCRNMCGAPSCPGRCAGRASNHSGSVRPAGAVDVSDYARFGQLMRQCPLSPRIHNALGARDPVHFSASGR